MRGHIISREYQKIQFIQDTDGKEYACYFENIRDTGRHLSDEEKNNCLDLSTVVGDSW